MHNVAIDTVSTSTYFTRLIDISSILSRKSCFLFGPRQTGKSSYIDHQLTSGADIRTYNLLDNSVYLALSRNPMLLREELHDARDLVVIDEVQKLPMILNEVHWLIEARGIRFLLTGSSARKLRRASVNLLGGRASKRMMYPLVSAELGEQFSLDTVLIRGSMPAIYLSPDYVMDLGDYIDLYLREEIAVEGAARSLPVFSRFLDVAAHCNGQIVNYNEVGRDAQLAPSTVREYFRLLQDSLLIERLPIWRESKKRKAASKDKFYFFDIGVARYLQGRRTLVRDSTEYGEALETYIFHELRSYLSYFEYRAPDTLSYWRTRNGIEVDFLIGNQLAIEVKSTRQVQSKHLKGLRALAEEDRHKRLMVISHDPRPRRVDGIDIMSIDDFLKKLWRHELLSQ